MPRALRLALVAALPVVLVTAVLGGLLRLGVETLPLATAGAPLHGPLLVSGFFGTLIALERAVALGAAWAYAAPLAGALGAGLLLAGAPVALGAGLATLASLGLLALSARVWRRQPALFTLALALGAAAWLAGNLLWLAGRPVAGAAPWWLGFLVLTIAAERLELSRLLRRPWYAERLFQILLAALLGGLLLGEVHAPAGLALFALALLALAAWLARYDVARRTIRQTGLPRYAAVCLFSGYAWLGAGALLLLTGGLPPAGPWYDAVLHAVLVGFVLAMVFAHAPIVLPAVAGLRLPYTPAFYGPLGLLHASLLLRLAGDLLGEHGWRAGGGIGNALALGLFMVLVVGGLVRGGRGR